jgi:predicted CXXCH cytochrome family protein
MKVSGAVVAVWSATVKIIGMSVTAIKTMKKLLLSGLLAALNVWLILFLPAQEPNGAKPKTQEPTGQDPVVAPPEHLQEDQDCVDCHDQYTKDKFVHEPVEEEMCDACHEQLDETLHTFDTPKDMSANCAMCHDDAKGDHIHQPVVEGNCSACHDPHQSEYKALLHTDNQAEMCLSCHEDSPQMDAQHVHGPVASGMCTLCHLPHASEQEKLLLDEPVSLCLSCHEDLDDRLDSAENIHIPVDEDCGLCHDAHATENEFQLLQAGSSLCFDCHDDIKQRTELAVEHKAVHLDAGCLNCHDAHHSNQPALQVNRGDEVCLSCHAEAVPGKDGEDVQAMGELLKLEFRHGPIEEGNCSSCHEPHGSETNSILREPYPPGFYSTWDPGRYQLCFRCHEESAFKDAKTEIHTDFRDGQTNLHFLHVNRQRKGRTCRACHEVHASSLPMHMAETVPFGGWSLPLNFSKSENGGSCSPGCHEPASYDRRVLPEEEK